MLPNVNASSPSDDDDDDDDDSGTGCRPRCHEREGRSDGQVGGYLQTCQHSAHPPPAYLDVVHQVRGREELQPPKAVLAGGIDLEYVDGLCFFVFWGDIWDLQKVGFFW
jgi:hypothetical protein